MLIILKRRLQISGAVSLLYFFTVILLSVYPQKNLHTLIFGLLLASAGSLATFLLIREWEAVRPLKKKDPVYQPSESFEEGHENIAQLEQTLRDVQIKNLELISQLNLKQESLLKFDQEKKQFELRMEDAAHQLNTYRFSAEEEMKRKTTLLTEYQETINQQREVIRKKQEHIGELESKVHDLNYEVKTLLQLAEMGSLKESPPPVETPEPIPSNPLVKTPTEASTLLKRCVDIAQKITSGSQLNNGTSRFQMPLNNYALDLRRLFDHLRSETSSTVIVYSQKENRLLFANNQSRNLLGWNVDKIVQNFPDLIQEGGDEWRKSMGRLGPNEEEMLSLLLKTKSGQNLLVHCSMRVIPTGIFKNHVIGVLYPA